MHGNAVLGLMGGGINMKNELTQPLRRRANMLSGSDWLRYSFSIWRGLGKNSEERKLVHPAMFTVGLVSRLLETYTCCNGETLLDPFAGTGTSLVAALNKNMKAIGFDVNRQFRTVFADRISELENTKQDNWSYYSHDARKMTKVIYPETVDICITSPPYWDILNRRRTADGKETRPYSAMKNDLGNIEAYGDFLAALGDVISDVQKVLKPGKFLILNVMDLRKKSLFYPLHMDAVAEANKHGFSLEDIIIWDRQDEYNNLRPLGYPSKFIINKVHEYLLVLRK